MRTPPLPEEAIEGPLFLLWCSLGCCLVLGPAKGHVGTELSTHGKALGHHLLVVVVIVQPRQAKASPEKRRQRIVLNNNSVHDC
jgi:hypothetical protein